MSEKEYLQVFGKTRDEMVAETREELRAAIKAKEKTKVKELVEKLKKVFVGDDVFWANEVASNIFVAVVMFLLLIIFTATMVLARAGIYDFDNSQLFPMLSLCMLELLVGILLVVLFRGEKAWLKYVAMFFVCATVAAATAILGYRSEICCVLPVILSTKYLSEKFTKEVSLVSGIFLFTSTISSAYGAVALDLNNVEFAPGTTFTIDTTLEAALAQQSVDMHAYISNLLFHSFLPNFTQYLLICYICITIAKWCHKTVLEQAQVATEFSRVDTELNMARDIQANVLPRIFPAYPERKEFDLFASMDPAKEVGGDFYDFFMIDDDHLAMVMADVSGKGVPAALFMMIGKAFIKNQTMTGASPADVFSYVNNELCENNELDLFITAWMGILEISTGHVIAVNAGHEYPAIRRAGGDYELFKDKHGFVLAGMEDFPYMNYEFDLKPGDAIFVYTDGVTEATNEEKKLFGTDRLIASLNKDKEAVPAASLKSLRADIDAFVGKASQFDDITMLELIYRGKES